MVNMRRKLHSAAGVVLTIMVLVSMPAQAWADAVQSWVLETQSGEVRLVKTGITPISLTEGDIFAGGDWIETGPDGRAILRRGDETIVVAPNSRIGLPSENTGPFATRILQTLGTILLTVEKKANRHFEVRTPYLAAVVKGTTFTVGLERARAVVHVVEGLVEVENLVSGRSNLVGPGQTGMVERGGAAEVQVIDGRDRAETEGDGPAIGAAVIRESLGPKAIDLAANTGGLIRVAGTNGLEGKLQASDLGSGEYGVVEGAVDTASSVASTQGIVEGPVASSLQPVSASLGAGLESATAPLTGVVEPVGGALSSIAQPVTAPLVSIAQPVTAPLASIAQPITAPLASIAQPITAPLASIAQPVTAPLASIAQPVTAPLASIAQPVSAPTPPPAPSGGSLLGSIVNPLLGN